MIGRHIVADPACVTVSPRFRGTRILVAYVLAAMARESIALEWRERVSKEAIARSRSARQPGVSRSRWPACRRGVCTTTPSVATAPRMAFLCASVRSFLVCFRINRKHVHCALYNHIQITKHSHRPNRIRTRSPTCSNVSPEARPRRRFSLRFGTDRTFSHWIKPSAAKPPSDGRTGTCQRIPAGFA